MSREPIKEFCEFEANCWKEGVFSPGTRIKHRGVKINAREVGQRMHGGHNTWGTVHSIGNCSRNAGQFISYIFIGNRWQGDLWASLGARPYSCNNAITITRE